MLPPRSSRSLVIVGVCACICVALIIAASRRSPVLLAVLFCGWVLSPFLGLLWCQSRARSAGASRTVNGASVILSLGSVGFYVLNAIRPLPAARALPYLGWPALSWIV